MIKIRYSGSYYHGYKDLLGTSPELKLAIERSVHLFTKNPDDSRLDNHPLKRRMEGKWAFSITADVRIVYEFIGRNSVRFLVIGPHTKVYS